MAICPQCQSENLDGADACANCGADLHDLGLPRPQTLVEHSIMTQPLTVLGRREPVTVAPDTPLADAIEMLAERRVSCLVVVEGDRAVGLLSERDVLQRAAGDYAQARGRPVRDFMTPDPVCLPREAQIIQAMHKMVVNDYRHVPVVDADAKLCCVVSGRNVMDHILNCVQRPGPRSR